MQAPSNKVGLTLIIVVLFVTGTIVMSKVQLPNRTNTNLEADSVDLIIERKINQEDFSWLEEFERTRLIPTAQKSDEFDVTAFAPGTLTEQMSIDLFTEYLNLKQKGFLTPEEEEQMTLKIVEQINSQIRFDANKYAYSDLNTTQSTPETVSIYGDRVAQVTLDNYSKMDKVRNLQEITYLKNIASIHREYVQELLSISVPDVLQEAHIEIVNGVYNTAVLFEMLTSDIEDPVVAITLLTQYQAVQPDDVQLYTLMAMYFKNNDIIFDTESTINFWNKFY